jgi:hypothetical protein
MIGYELGRWWAYRQIRHPKMRIYVWFLPGVIAATLTLIFLALPIRPAVSGAQGLLAAIVQFLAVLPGFFIASLAAVATFQRPEMDVEMPSPAPTVPIQTAGRKYNATLTRRIFLSYLFSYLAIASLFLLIFCLLSNLLAPAANKIIYIGIFFGDYQGLVKDGLLGIFLLFTFYWCASIVITMLHGIYFLTERMHQPS